MSQIENFTPDHKTTEQKKGWVDHILQKDWLKTPSISRSNILFQDFFLLNT